MEFDISKDGTVLEARQVNVDEPDFNDWTLLFSIPIVKHYFYEKDVDSRGRELNKFMKVSDRKNWQLQPWMDLNLKQIKFHDWRKAPTRSRFDSTVVVSAYDFDHEVKQDANFLGFTALTTSFFRGSDIQNELRVNFLEFKGTPGFKMTPYDLSLIHI